VLLPRGSCPPTVTWSCWPGCPLWLLQNWRLEHHRQPDEAVVDRIVRQFYPSLSPGLMRVCGRASRCWPGRRSRDLGRRRDVAGCVASGTVGVVDAVNTLSGPSRRWRAAVGMSRPIPGRTPSLPRLSWSGAVALRCLLGGCGVTKLRHGADSPRRAARRPPVRLYGAGVRLMPRPFAVADWVRLGVLRGAAGLPGAVQLVWRGQRVSRGRAGEVATEPRRVDKVEPAGGHGRA